MPNAPAVSQKHTRGVYTLCTHKQMVQDMHANTVVIASSKRLGQQTSLIVDIVIIVPSLLFT